MSKPIEKRKPAPPADTGDNPGLVLPDVPAMSDKKRIFISYGQKGTA
jgi:hypothetical protein